MNRSVSKYKLKITQKNATKWPESYGTHAIKAIASASKLQKQLMIVSNVSSLRQHMEYPLISL